MMDGEYVNHEDPGYKAVPRIQPSVRHRDLWGVCSDRAEEVSQDLHGNHKRSPGAHSSGAALFVS